MQSFSTRMREEGIQIGEAVTVQTPPMKIS
jgi:hypothetical protein